MSTIKFLISVLIVLCLSFAIPLSTPALTINLNVQETSAYSVNSQAGEWLTYQNQTLGYEFQYPSDWQLREGSSMGYPYVTLIDSVAQTLPAEALEINQGALIEISAEEFRAVVPVEEYIKNNVRPAFGENGELLEVTTEESTSTVWGVEGFHYIHHRGKLLQQNHAALVVYPEGSLLFQIMITIPDATQESNYVNIYNGIVETLVLHPTTSLPELQKNTVESFENNVLGTTSSAEVQDEAQAYTTSHYLTLPFYSHADMKVQQGWVSSYDPRHYGIDYIKGQFDDKTTWQSFDVLAAADGKACLNCTNTRSGTTVWIKHTVNNLSFYTYYGHLDWVDPSIPVGSQNSTITVKRGQKIGTAGDTDAPGLTHLHFTSWANLDGTLKQLDPYDINPDSTKSLSETRKSYYPNSTYTSMGPNHVFTSDPPSYFGGSSDVSQGAGPTVDVVEIIDSSGSMYWNDPYGQRRNAAKTFVDTSIEGDFVGVVDFDNFSRLASPLLRLPDNRQTLFSAIDTIDEFGGTNLGAGLQTGCDALINSNSSNAKKGAIFLTDGRGSYSGQATCYSSRGWPIFAFGLDDADDALLTDIATSTGGEYKRLPTTNLACEFQRVRNKISGIDASPCHSVYINPLQHIFYLLRVLHGQAQITMSTSWGGSDVEMSLASPSGRIIDRNTIAEDVVHDVSGTHEVFTIINPEPGEWKVGLFGADIPVSGEEVVFGFTSFPQHSADTTGVFRPSNGLLYLKNSNDTGFADIAINYGIPGDYPVVGDWDGNGTTTIGVYRSGSFYLRNSNIIGFAEIVFPFGQLGDQPIAGDWNGDGIDTIGIYRPSTGQFQLRNSNDAGPPQMSFYLGNVGDVGIAGDWNGDGIDTTGVFRPSNGIIFLKNTNTTGIADIALNYGLPGDKPLTGDWNGDGIDTIGVYRNGQFLLRNSNTVGFADIVFGLGNPGDMPLAGDWDGMP